MSQDKELEIRLQFLDEAQEYLNTIESVLLGLDTRAIKEQMDAALRAAHSIKGGAAMMGFEALSHLAHRLEDSFKVLKAKAGKQALDDELVSQLLAAVDYMRQVSALYLAGKVVEEQWLTTQVNPVFELLYARLGDPQDVEDLSAEAAETGQDMVALLFETEVEGCLQRLEAVIADPQKPFLLEECKILAQELGGLGEMLQLNAFSSLCNSIGQHLETAPERVEEIAELAVQQWRRSQALVLLGQIDNLPQQLDVPSSLETSIVPIAADTTIEEDFFDLPLDLDQFIPPSDDIILDFAQFSEEVSDFAAAYQIEDSFDSQLEAIAPTTEKEVAAEFDWAAIPQFEEATVVEPELKTSPETRVVRREKERASEKPGFLAEATVPEKQENTVRLPVRQLEQLNDLFGELTISRNGLELRLTRLANLVKNLSRRVRVLEQSNAQLGRAYNSVNKPNKPGFSKKPGLSESPEKQGLSDVFDILEMDQYDDLYLLSHGVMESIVQIQEVTTDIELSLDDTNQTARELNRTAKQMQTSLTQVRMRPLSDIVGRFPRAVRDLCVQYGKNVELKIYGSGTLIDRTIIESLNDPLMHLLRNAFDHGIETPAIRRQNGKPELGVIEIRAAYRGNQTLITISDNGGGIPIDKIREKAEKMGLDADDIAAAGEKALLELIFEPGFSTAEQVTNLSGRGVGMDVVRTNLKQVRGDIKVDTQLGVGTTFTISVPFTLSVMRVLLVESNGTLLAFPRDAIEEMILLETENILISGDAQVLNWEDYLVPLINMSQWLEFNCPHKTVDTEGIPSINEPTTLIVSQGTHLFGIKIDRCWGEQEVTIRQVEGTIPLPSGLSGCAVLGDGRIAPLVDVPALLTWIAETSNSSGIAPQRQLDRVSLAKMAVPESQKNMILIIDDSINVRRLLALTLEKAGYEVEQAKDGQDALDKLLGGLEVKAVICDIEMPRLDGYGFLGRVKSYPAFKQLPVAMLTSRSGDKHRRIAMNLGAAAYFSKPYKEQELVRTIEVLVQS